MPVDAKGPVRLRLPFVTARSFEIPPDPGWCAFSDYLARVSKLGDQLALEVSGISSEQDAKLLFERLRGAFLLASVSHRIGLTTESRLTPVHYYEPPLVPRPGFLFENQGQLDGSCDAHHAVIFLERHRVMTSYVPKAWAGQIFNGEWLLGVLAPELGLRFPERVVDNRRLRLACEQYASALHQTWPALRIISLVTALEAVCERANRPQALLDRIKRFGEECDAEALGHPAGPIKDGFKQMHGSLVDLRRESIGAALCKLVVQYLRHDSDGSDPVAIGREFSSIYGLRSKLLHEGISGEEPIRSAIIRLEDIVPRVLTNMAREVAAGGASGDRGPR